MGQVRGTCSRRDLSPAAHPQHAEPKAHQECSRRLGDQRGTECAVLHARRFWIVGAIGELRGGEVPACPGRQQNRSSCSSWCLRRSRKSSSGRCDRLAGSNDVWIAFTNAVHQREVKSAESICGLSRYDWHPTRQDISRRRMSRGGQTQPGDCGRGIPIDFQNIEFVRRRRQIGCNQFERNATEHIELERRIERRGSRRVTTDITQGDRRSGNRRNRQ